MKPLALRVPRRLSSVLALTALALTLIVAAPMSAEEEQQGGSEHCRTAVAGSETAEGCEVTGTQLEVGVGTFEPTMGADGDGNLYYARADRENGVLIGFGAGTAKSEDGGESWIDVTPQVAGIDVPPETNDPMLYVDPGTDRVFQFHMSPILTCSVLSFTDDGGDSWTTNPFGCGPTAVWDHQTIVAATPRVLPTNGYPNVLHQCVNSVYAAMCSRSLDGGLTWSPGAPAYLNEHPETGRGAQHGHLVAAPDGTVYLPSPMMAKAPTVWVTRDDGLTWERSVISDIEIPFTDPAIAVDEDGNVYATFVDRTGTLLFATSTDAARTWSEAVPIAPGVTATMPAMIAGDTGRVAIAYPGTADLPDGFATPADDVDPELVSWGGFITVTDNALDAQPTFTTVNASGGDPLMRGRNACQNGGRCVYQVDFIGITVAPDGAVYASLADGCTGPCASGEELRNNESHGRGVVLTLDGVSLCAERCARFDAPSSSSTEGGSVMSGFSAAAAASAREQTPVPFTSGQLTTLLAQADEERRALASGVHP